MLNDDGKYSFNDWFRKFSEINLKNKSVILVCAVGGRSYYFAKIINRIKGKNITIYNLQKGILNWISEGNQIVKYN